jgi:hypothetical protein
MLYSFRHPLCPDGPGGQFRRVARVAVLAGVLQLPMPR